MKRNQSGFSLMEVNMAIFVMAVGVLAMVALFPLGLRESVQSQADLKESMFADFMLNAIVAAASSTNVQWSDWGQWAHRDPLDGLNARELIVVRDPPNIGTLNIDAVVRAAEAEYNRGLKSNFQLKRNESYAVYCAPVQGHSSLIMGILVRSLSMDQTEMKKDGTGMEMRRRLEARPVYYAEARFQGVVQ
ncbi:MAG: prepilin-type N-terminal cleavage/methylation domain-containing protein [Kiritimatiellaeota bacterium]|nr:prepilin-type N-terminal cleavage/methylation domain-containing protein [Kiritimatiellota bacterium]